MNRCLFIMLILGLAGCARFQSRPISPAETATNLETRRLDDAAFRQFLEKNLQRPFASWPPSEWDFETLTLAALYYHPSLDVARAQWNVALGGNKTAAAHPNPTISAIPGYDLSAASAASPWLPSVSFDLPVETMGKRRFRKNHAEQLSESARLNIITTAWQVRSNLRTSLIDYSAAHQREALLQKQQSIQEQIVKSLDQQLQAGAISSSELALVRIAQGRIQLDLADARRLSADVRVRVADAIGLSVAALDGVNLHYDLSQISSVDSVLSSAEVRRQALLGRADVLGALAEYEASQSALQLEIAKQYPDIHLGPAYQYDLGEHKISLSLTAELPILNQNQGPIAEAEARRAESAARFLALQAKVLTEVDRALTAYQVTRENMSVLESLTGAQKKQYSAVEGQLQAGAVSQFDLLNSQIELSAGELIQLDGRVKWQQARGAVEDALQRPIDSMKPLLLEQSPRAPALKEKKP